MKILSVEQLRALDKYTIATEPIASIDLMERAAAKIFEELTQIIKLNETVFIFCGMGNNGGDGLAIARMLIEAGYKHVSVYVVKHSAKASKDFLLNEQRLKNIAGLRYIETENQIPKMAASTIVIDAIFGTGLTKPVEGLSAAVIQSINQSAAKVYSVDMPSGLFADKSNADEDVIVSAHRVFTFHSPKISFLLPQNGKYVPDFKVLDIGLNKEYTAQLTGNYEYVTAEVVQQFFKQRKKYSHKGTYGHALIAAGSYGKIGAAVLSVKAALRSGAGLVSALIPSCGYEMMQSTNPEAMVNIGGKLHLENLPDLSAYSSLAVGPGIGTDTRAAAFVEELLKTYRQPMVLDADALNIIAAQKNLLQQLPENSILTPHPGEFKRLVGEWKNDFEKLAMQTDFSVRYKIVTVLKGAHTTVTTPEGKIYFNSTGNAGMAKGGSGDVLTGIIGALLAQNYSAAQAAVLGVFVHGLAGDLAKENLGETAMKAGDIISCLPQAFQQLELLDA
jgi:NAD(P)H-hydrate epimerase